MVSVPRLLEVPYLCLLCTRRIILLLVQTLACNFGIAIELSFCAPARDVRNVFPLRMFHSHVHTRAHTLWFFFVGFTFVFVLCQAYVSSVYESPCLPLSFRWPLGLPCRPRPLSLCLASSLAQFFHTIFHSFYISCLVFFCCCSTHALFMLLSILCTHFKGGNSIARLLYARTIPRKTDNQLEISPHEN